MIKILLSFFCLSCSSLLFGQMTQESINRITHEINQIRKKGITCGAVNMPPVHEIYWNDQLYTASTAYAKYMEENNHFDHLSLEGEDAGTRLDKIGYNWRYVGENLAVGQYDFYEVLSDWIESDSHCKMLMSPQMQHFALARNQKYWVQTFAAPMR